MGLNLRDVLVPLITFPSPNVAQVCQLQEWKNGHEMSATGHPHGKLVQ
ncbi:MAG: hypothetical protein KF716_33940 [Anaerolineae bacterium]|nr:hypothetical protein [Anaerolineae bacterium]